MQSRGSSMGSFASSAYAGGGAQAAESGGLRIGSLGAAAVDLGTAKNPVHMMQVKRQTADSSAMPTCKFYRDTSTLDARRRL